MIVKVDQAREPRSGRLHWSDTPEGRRWRLCAVLNGDDTATLDVDDRVILHREGVVHRHDAPSERQRRTCHWIDGPGPGEAGRAGAGGRAVRPPKGHH